MYKDMFLSCSQTLVCEDPHFMSEFKGPAGLELPTGRISKSGVTGLEGIWRVRSTSGCKTSSPSIVLGSLPL